MHLAGFFCAIPRGLAVLCAARFSLCEHSFVSCRCDTLGCRLTSPSCMCWWLCYLILPLITVSEVALSPGHHCEDICYTSTSSSKGPSESQIPVASTSCWTTSSRSVCSTSLACYFLVHITAGICGSLPVSKAKCRAPSLSHGDAEFARKWQSHQYLIKL